jgi:hypothetical protein
MKPEGKHPHNALIAAQINSTKRAERYSDVNGPTSDWAACRW